MIRLDYDILFSVRAVLLAADGAISNRIPARSWRFAPSQETRKRMKDLGMLFKEVDGYGLFLAEPSTYEQEDGKELAIFNLAEALQFTVEVRLDQKTLLNRIDRGPGPRDTTATFPEEKQVFFSQAFPNGGTAYVLHQSRLLQTQPPLGINDLVAQPGGGLGFNKASYTDIVLKGPLPGEQVIPPNTFPGFSNGDTIQIEDSTAFRYSISQMPEGVYRLSGKKRQPDDSMLDFAGEVFLSKGALSSPIVAYLDIEIPAGRTEAEQRTFVLPCREKIRS